MSPRPRGERPTEITYDEASDFPIAGCQSCSNTGLMLGGWMGPTDAAPWPRACTCAAGQELDTPRKVQLKVVEIVGRSREERPTGSYWTAKYPLLAELDQHLEAIDDCSYTESPLPPVFGFEPKMLVVDEWEDYRTAIGENVVISEHMRRPPVDVLARADIWKVRHPDGRMEVVKHRTGQTPYFECDAAVYDHQGRVLHACNRPQHHSGQHETDKTGRTWR